MILFTLKPSQSFIIYRIQGKDFFGSEKKIFKEKGEWTIDQKRKEFFLTALVTAIKKDPTKSIRKQVKELKVHVKTVRKAIKQYLNLENNPLDYTIGASRKQMQLAIQISASIRLLLKRNGIKGLRNIFWRHANCYEYVLIQ